MSGLLTQTIVFDEDTGEVKSDSTRRGSQNGKGWIIMYTEKVQELICECDSAATLKVFMLLSLGQQYDERGMITTKQAVQEKLGITKQTCLAAFKWLKEHMIINECKINGHTEFMVNPRYVTIGRDKKKREKEWIRRWAGQVVQVQKLPVIEVVKSAPPVVNKGRSITIK